MESSATSTTSQERYGAAELQDASASNGVGASADVTLCVNLCETTAPDASADALADALAEACYQAGFPYCERIYAGSYFCENYFLHLHDEFHDALRALCRRYELKATLVVPIAGQAFLDRVEARVCDLLSRYGDVYDEVVVNDVGQFAGLNDWLSAGGNAERVVANPVRIGVGRLFSKELRDARYAEMRESTSHPAFSAEVLACLAMQQSAQPGARALVEVDPTAAIVDVSGLAAEAAASLDSTAPAIEIAIHLPYCYATTGRNCGPASVDEPENQKFRLGRGCGQHCLRMRQGYLTDEGASYVKHGRTYYFANPECAIAGTPSWRIIYSDLGDYA